MTRNLARNLAKLWTYYKSIHLTYGKLRANLIPALISIGLLSGHTAGNTVIHSRPDRIFILRENAPVSPIFVFLRFVLGGSRLLPGSFFCLMSIIRSDILKLEGVTVL